jgi:glycosyltransferase involved in cell wall biosynthesis
LDELLACGEKMTKNNNPKVSIILVTYNAEKFIKKTIDSCLNQDYKNKEILVLDNKSDDSTREILRDYAKKNKNIKVYYSKLNIGPYRGLNYLIKKSNGELIAIQDHDDLWLPKKISLQVKFLLENKDFIGVGTNSYTYFEKEEIFLLKDRSGVVNSVTHTSLLFWKRDNFQYKLNEVLTDEYFQNKILTRKGKLFCINKFLTIRRIRKDGRNLSSYRFKLNIENMKSFYRTNGLSIQSMLYLFEITINSHLTTKLNIFKKVYLSFKGAHWKNLKDFKKENPQLEI